jgi:hypothetical protein
MFPEAIGQLLMILMMKPRAHKKVVKCEASSVGRSSQRPWSTSASWSWYCQVPCLHLYLL